MKKYVKMLFMARSKKSTGFTDAEDNFEREYPEFFELNETDKEWFGAFTKKSNTQDPNGIIRMEYEGYIRTQYEYDFLKLTHHAEGIYMDTDLEDVHVECCVMEECWHGRNSVSAT